MTYKYVTKGVCSRSITFDLTDGIVSNIKFEGGCNGNTQGVAALAEGMKAEDVIAKVEGIRCGFKTTSCPDQLAAAIKQAMSK